MYNTSTQKKCWRFLSEADLQERRTLQNQTFIQKHGQHMPHGQQLDFFISAQEERILLRHYEFVLLDFCKTFDPPMPNYVKGTAFTYMKRFYLKNTAMDYHPQDIMVICVYLACKVEEFNVSITQFSSNIYVNREEVTEIMLANELLLAQQLNFHLIVHNPYIPLEGFLIDIETYCNIQDIKRFAVIANGFLDRILLTDACLLYTPAQIALAALLHAASKEQENLDSFVTDVLFKDMGNLVPHLINVVRKIRSMIKSIAFPDQDNVKFIEMKLERCRNQANNPHSSIYKERQRRELCDEDAEVEEYLHNAADSSAELTALNMSVDK